MQAGADLDPKIAHCGTNGLRTADRSGWAVESGQQSVAGGHHLAAAEAFELLAGDRVVTLKQFLPGMIAERIGLLRRSHDVGEQHRGENTFRLRKRPYASQELLQ